MWWRPLIIFTILFWSLWGLLGCLRTEPSEGALIAFVSTRTGTAQVHLMLPDGSGVRQLTQKTTTQGYFYPRWTNDGKLLFLGDGLHIVDFEAASHLVFKKFNQYELAPNKKWLVAVDDSALYAHVIDLNTYQVVTSFDESNFAVLWSPDGELALVAGYGTPFNNYPYRLDTLWQDGTLKPLLPDWRILLYKGWTPDSEWILFWWSDDGHDEIYRIHPDGTGLEQLTHSTTYAREAEHSPDGKWIAYLADGSACVMTIDGQDQRCLLDNLSDDDGIWTWAIDSSSFAVWRGSTAYTIPLDQSAIRPTDFTSYQVADVWSDTPHGMLLVSSPTVDIYMSNPQKSELRRVTNDIQQEGSIELSPNGDWITYHLVDDITGMGEIYRVRPDGTDRQNLSRHRKSDTQPTWSPIIDMDWHPQWLGAFGGVLSALGGWLSWRRRETVSEKMC